MGALDTSFGWAFRSPEWKMVPGSYEVVTDKMPNGTLHSFTFCLARVWQPYFWNYFLISGTTS